MEKNGVFYIGEEWEKVLIHVIRNNGNVAFWKLYRQ